MNKKIIIGIVLVIIAIIGVGAIVYNTSKSSETERQGNSEENNQLSVVNKNSNENEIVDNKTDNDKNTGSKTLVVYFSAQNHTKTVAEKIAKNLDANIFEIKK